MAAVGALAVTSAVPVATAAPAAAPAATPGTGRTAPSAPRFAQAGFGLQTAADGKPDGRGIVTYGVTPGATQRDEVAVVNIGRRPLRLDLYTTDATSGAQGEVGLLPRTAEPTDIGTWVSLGGHTSVRVPARTAKGPSYVVVPYSVVVPANATPGDHIGGIVASLTSKVKNGNGVDVELDQRVALSVVARVSGTVRAQLAIEDLHVDFHGPSLTSGNPLADGSATVTYRVHNTGNVQLGGLQRVLLDPTLGGAVASRVSGVATLLPGGSAPQTVVVTGVYPGLSIDAHVEVTPVAAPGATTGRLTPATADTSVTAVPWLLLALIVLLVLAVVAVALRIRTLRRRPASQHRRSRGRTPARTT